MKELLRKAFEAGKDKQWDIEWQMGRSKPGFEEWYKEHEIQALNIPDVVGRSEQFISLIKELINVGIIDEDDIEVETWVKNYIKEINCR